MHRNPWNRPVPASLETHALVGAPIVVAKSSPAYRLRFFGLGRVVDFAAAYGPTGPVW